MNKQGFHPRALFAFALSAALASGAALAQQASSNAQPARAEGGMHDRMMQLDTDHDGRVSQKEAAANPELAQRFAKFDGNHDGYIDRSDFQARKQQQRDACFATADADKDGKLSRAEFDAANRQCHRERGARGPRPGGETPPPAG